MTSRNPSTLLGSPPVSEMTRSQADLASSIRQRFERSGYLALRNVACEVSGDVASLRGRVDSYYLKQIAQVVAGETAGVRFVVNQIEVVPSRESRGERALHRTDATQSPDVRTAAWDKIRISDQSATKEWERCWS